MIHLMNDDTPQTPGDDTADPTDDTPLRANLPQNQAPLMSSVSYASSDYETDWNQFSKNVFPSAILQIQVSHHDTLQCITMHCNAL